MSESAVLCMRVQSDKPVDCKAAGVGWLHRIGDDKPKPPPRRQPKSPDMQPEIDWHVWQSTAEDAVEPRALGRLAADLSVSVMALRAMGIGWAVDKRAWSFPMRDTEGEIVGIRLRNDAGRKWAVTGSSNGLFIPNGHVPDQADEILICEGPTDAAALHDLGFPVIGRPACRGLEWEVCGLVAWRDAVVVGDRDTPKTRPDGSTWRPGQEGAHKLAACLNGRARTTKLILPLRGKDARAWKALGATRDIVRAVIDNALIWRPHNGR